VQSLVSISRFAENQEIRLEFESIPESTSHCSIVVDNQESDGPMEHDVSVHRLPFRRH
jgi:hypothetical protein